jgi:kinetochore protein Spc7/SPC105
MSAPPDVRSIMDNQFKNVKTHARLLSKAMWYEWRMKLVEGLKEGLLRIGEGFNRDAEILADQEQLLSSVVPDLVREHEQLVKEAAILQAQADELANCDQEELTDAREKLVSVDAEVTAKRAMLEKLQSEFRQHEQHVEQVVERKAECLEEIKEAERVREECRGWSTSEVSALKGITSNCPYEQALTFYSAKVDEFEEAHGWTIVSASDLTLTLTYQRTLQLFLTPSSFLPAASSPTSPISLTYLADTHPYHPIPLSTEKRFFLQLLRAHLQCLPQSQTRLKSVLDLIGTAWQRASRVADEIRQLNAAFMTEAAIRSDEVLAATATVLLRDMRTKVAVDFVVAVRDGVEGRLDVRVAATVVYGEVLKEDKMAEFLRTRVLAEGRVVGDGGWVAAVRELEARLKARGRRSAEP